MYGDGSTARDYTFVEDTVQGILSGVDYLLSKNGIYETINLGNHSPLDLKSLISMIYSEMGIEPNVIIKGMQDGDVNITFANIDKAQNLLDYYPETQMKAGIKKFIDWYRQQ